MLCRQDGFCDNHGQEYAPIGDFDLRLFGIRLTSARLESERELSFGQTATRVSLVLTAEVNNRDTGMPIVIRHCALLPIGPSTPCECEAFIGGPSFQGWLRHEVSRLLTHEVDENLYRDGRLVNDPHAPRSIEPSGPPVQVHRPRQFPTPEVK